MPLGKLLEFPWRKVCFQVCIKNIKVIKPLTQLEIKFYCLFKKYISYFWQNHQREKVTSQIDSTTPVMMRLNTFNVIPAPVLHLHLPWRGLRLIRLENLVKRRKRHSPPVTPPLETVRPRVGLAAVAEGSLRCPPVLRASPRWGWWWPPADRPAGGGETLVTCWHLDECWITAGQVPAPPPSPLQWQ